MLTPDSARVDRTLFYEAFNVIGLATYYVDAAVGSDSNSGTETAPLESYLPFVSAYGQDDPNVGRIELQPSDEIIFASGAYDQTF